MASTTKTRRAAPRATAKARATAIDGNTAKKTQPRGEQRIIRDPHVKFAVEDITPKKALQLLEGNTSNRNLRERVIAKYARDMVNGVWEQTGDPIRVSPEGQLLDGQHRLHAVVQSEVTVPMLVVRGVQKTSVLAIDTGAKRSFPDILKLRGYKNVVAVSAAARWNLAYEQGTMTSPFSFSNAELMAYVEKRRDMVEVVNDLAGRVGGGNLGSEFLTSPLQALIAIKLRGRVEDFEAFVHGLRTGEQLTSGSPILALRRLVTNSRIGTTRTSPKVVQACTIKAWNAWIEGRQMQLVAWRPGGAAPEPFPTIITEVVPS